MTDVIQYNITERDAYGKQIENIKQKNCSKIWENQVDQQQIIIKGQFKDAAYITSIEFRPTKAQKVKIILQNSDEQKIFDCQFIYKYGNFETKSKNVQTKQQAMYFSLILGSEGLGLAKKWGINYLVFKGEKDAMKIPKQKISNLSKQQTLEIYNHDSKMIGKKSKPIEIGKTSRPYYDRPKTYKPKPQQYRDQRDMFNVRQKQKAQTKGSQSNQNSKEDIQLQKILKLSEQQYKEQQKRKKQTISQAQTNIYGDIQIDIDSTTEPMQPIKLSYEIRPLAQILPFCQHYNQKYIDAQKAAEIKYGIKEQHKLSKYLKVRQ